MSNVAITKQNIGIETDTILITSINLKPDNSGEWDIEVECKPIIPERPNNDDVNFMERHIIFARVKVTRAEIAVVEKITEEEVRTTLTLEQVEAIVTQLAKTKVLGVLNLTE